MTNYISMTIVTPTTIIDIQMTAEGTVGAEHL
jgi:hypothetical protein